MIDPPDRAELQRRLEAEMARYDAANGPATTTWRRFRRWRHQRLYGRLLYDRHTTQGL